MPEPIAPGGLYSYRNPPPSHDVALARLHELEVAVQSIEVQLQHSNPNEFPSDDDFLTWKGRATGAAGHYRAEIGYLERWVGARGSQSGQGGPQHVSGAQYRTGVEEITTKVRNMTTQVREKYKRIYSEGHQPADVATARARRQELSSVIQMCTGFFKELKLSAEAAGLGEERMAKLRKPLSTIYMDVQAENKVIAKFFRENVQEGPRDVNWTLFLLSVIERAVKSGFVMTDEEKNTAEAIRDAKLSQM